MAPVTIKKEIDTFRAVWNWGQRNGLVGGAFPSDGLVYPKSSEVLPYMRWGEIERRIKASGDADIHLSFATPRNWSKKSVLRTGPCLLGLFSVVSLIFHRHTRGQGVRPEQWAWYAMAETTFGDAMTCVRRLCWSEVFQKSPKHGGVAKLPRSLRIMLLDHLSRAA